MYDKMNTSFGEFGTNTLSITTFNYDRSVEHFLFTAPSRTPTAKASKR
jgi:hypothetical protein